MLKGSFAICESTPTATKLGAFRALVLACLLFAPGIGPATAASDETVRNFVERVNHASTDLLSRENADRTVPQSARLGLRRAGDGPICPWRGLGPGNERGARGLLGRVRGRDRRRLSSPHAGLSRRDDELCRSKAVRLAATAWLRAA